MLGSDFHELIIDPLQRTGIPHMVTGGVAAIMYGEPRLTNNVDIVAQLTTRDAERLVKAYPPLRQSRSRR